MVANLPKWTGDASNLTGLARKRSASAEMGAWEADPAADAEAAFLDGVATDSDPDGITQPGERLRVCNLAGYGEPLFLSEVLITSKSLAKEAAALSYMKQGPYDIRPSLLLLMASQETSRAAQCVTYAKNYLRSWCAHQELTVDEKTIKAAAVDGLAVVYRLRSPRSPSRKVTPPLAIPATKLRAKTLRIRDESFRRLRAIVIDVLQSRYVEAVVLFKEAQGVSRDTTGGIRMARRTVAQPRRHGRRPDRRGLAGRRLAG